MRRQFNIPSQKLIVIPNGVDVEELMNAKGRILRQSGLLKKEVLTMLYVGRVDRRKNVQEIIGAMALLRERLNKDFRLVIVAASEGRKRLARLQEIAKQKSVDQLIEWKQNVPRDLLLEEYARASLFVFPSEIEAFGLAVREAIAMGVPAIVANAGALRDLTKAGLAIGIDLPITSEKIVDCIIRVVQETQLCRKTVTFKTWNQVAEMLVGVYRTKLVRCEGPSTSASV
jgi:glycosyltransferase involved in cell wall biosynthesis